MIGLIMGMIAGAWTYKNGGWPMIGLGIGTIIALEITAALLGWDTGKFIVELFIAPI